MSDSSIELRVHHLPQFVAEYDLADRTVVMVDLLRASTTICQALASGARDVVPFVEVADAWQAAADYVRAEIVLGGERGGQPIEGFDVGNSPGEYTPDVVFGRRILFTTTNGTRALEHARLARHIVVGAIVNLSAVVDSLLEMADGQGVDILCAGTGGHVTREDSLAAGAMVHRLLERASPPWSANETAAAVCREWEELLTAARVARQSISEQLAQELRRTPGGRNLLAIDRGSDLIRCAKLDAVQIVPVLDIAAWRIHLP